MSPPSALTSLVVLMMLCSGGVAFSPSLPPALPRSLPPTLSLHQPSTLRLSPLSRAGVSLRPQRRAQFPLMAEPSPDVAFQHAMQGDDWKMNAGGNVPGCNGDGAYISQGREMQRRSVLQGAAMLPFVLAGFSEKASAKEGDLVLLLGATGLSLFLLTLGPLGAECLFSLLALNDFNADPCCSRADWTVCYSRAAQPRLQVCIPTCCHPYTAATLMLFTATE